MFMFKEVIYGQGNQISLYKTFFYGRIDFSEGIDVNSDISSSEYVMYHFRYFLT